MQNCKKARAGALCTINEGGVFRYSQTSGSEYVQLKYSSNSRWGETQRVTCKNESSPPLPTSSPQAGMTRNVIQMTRRNMTLGRSWKRNIHLEQREQKREIASNICETLLLQAIIIMNVVSLWEGNKQLICIVALKLLKNNITAVKNKLLNENSSLFHPASKSPWGLYHWGWVLL